MEAEKEYNNAEEEVRNAEDACQVGVKGLPINLTLVLSHTMALTLTLTDIKGAKKRLRRAEERLEVAMESALMAEMNDEDEEEAEGGAFLHRKQKRKKQGRCPSEELAEAGASPLNFSRVNCYASEEEIKKRWPKYLEATESIVNIEAGDMLYLPAGWFHEVTFN